jgi:hypothetical protein
MGIAGKVAGVLCFVDCRQFARYRVHDLVGKGKEKAPTKVEAVLIKYH